jgi:hypothetical protein
MSRNTTTTINVIQKGLLTSVAKYEQAILKEQELETMDNMSTDSSEGELDNNVASAFNKKPFTSSKLFKKYATILRRLKRVNIEDSVFIYCSMLFKKVMSKRKSSLKAKDLLKIFTACVFISFKFVVDDLLFYAKDYCTLTGMDQKMLEMLESAILVNILGFNVNFSREEFEQEKRYLKMTAYLE